MNPRIDYIIGLLEDIQNEVESLYPEDIYELLDEAIQNLLMLEAEE